MPESSKHLELVQCILAYIRWNYSGIQHVATLYDLPGFIGCDKPPKIGTFRPDVYAIDAPLTRAIIGEAKTQLDLETDHTKEQFVSFISYLRLQRNAVFVVAVPWQAKARARSILEALARRLDTDSVQVVVIDDAESFQ